MFDMIRKEFARETGRPASLFSFNSKGACPKCRGQGFLSLDLYFLDTVKTNCDMCRGTRYKDEVLDLQFNHKTIADVLDMTVNSALGFFARKEILKRLQILQDVGLGYLRIGQSLISLSGGESQRLKLASELHKEGNIYILDEPTTGLHMSDIEKLYKIIRSLIDNHNTVIIIEHNLDIIRHADWIIDLGPGGGKNGGELIFQGRPEDLVNESRSITGKYLALKF
jgi:excinuclease UvrABC ATPase subunit